MDDHENNGNIPSHALVEVCKAVACASQQLVHSHAHTLVKHYSRGSGGDLSGLEAAKKAVV